MKTKSNQINYSSIHYFQKKQLKKYVIKKEMNTWAEKETGKQLDTIVYQPCQFTGTQLSFDNLTQ